MEASELAEAGVSPASQPFYGDWDQVGSFDIRGDGRTPGIWTVHKGYPGQKK